MNRSSRTCLAILCLTLLPVGCADPGKDSHAEVFKTPQEAAAERRLKQVDAWKDLAVSVMKGIDPAVTATKGAETSITLAADGLQHPVDFAPIMDELSKHPSEERTTMRQFMLAEARAFADDRLIAGGFAKTRARIFPRFVSTVQREALEKTSPQAPATGVVIGLFWVPVVRGDGNGGAATVLTPHIIQGWKVTSAQVSQAALDNLRAALKQSASPIETTTYPALGRSGALGGGIPAEVVLLPEFLDAVRATWGTRDDLILSVPSARTVSFCEKSNAKLLAKLVPQWKQVAQTLPDPLLTQPLLKNDQGLSLFSYTPATKPATTTAPTTKPHSYIVH